MSMGWSSRPVFRSRELAAATNPHRRKVPSYYPITAHLAETTHVLRVQNRSGNVHDSRGAVAFLRELWGQLGAFSLPSRQLRFRMDGAFFHPCESGSPGARSATPSRSPSSPG